MKKLLILTVFIAGLANATNIIKARPFQRHSINADSQVRLSVIDLSEYSIKWLMQYSDYLAANKIPVMILDGKKSDAIILNRKFKGLQSGPAPTRKYIELFLHQWGIKAIPAVIENGQVWQHRELQK